MEFRLVPPALSELDKLRHEVVAMGIFDDDRPFRGIAAHFDWRLLGLLSRHRAAGHFDGRAGAQTILPGRPRLTFDKLLLVGLGERAAFDLAGFDRALATVFESVLGLRLRGLAMALPGRHGFTFPVDEALRVLTRRAHEQDRLDDLVLLDDAEIERPLHKAIDAERRRLLALRALAGTG